LKLPAHVLFRKELSLMVWKPHGVLDQALVNEIVAFVEAAEERVEKPFNRFIDLSALDAVDLNFNFVFHIALHRRLAFESHPPVKTAFYVTSPDTTHYAKLHAMLTDHSPLHVSLFTERAAAAKWLGVPVEALEGVGYLDAQAAFFEMRFGFNGSKRILPKSLIDERIVVGQDGRI
jgi:hypothetical protein